MPRLVSTVLRADRHPIVERADQHREAVKPFCEHWAVIAPASAAEHSYPALYADGLLTVWVESPVWASAIRHAQQTIMDRLRTSKLPPVVSLQIRVVPDLKTGQLTASAAVNPAFKLSTQCPTARMQRTQPSVETLSLLESTAESIHDSKLRASLRRLRKTLANSE